MNTPLTALELAWQRTLREWQIRATVEECLQEMVQDIDVANRLEEQLRTTEEVSQLKRQVLEYEIALEEARAVQNQTTQSQRELADRLVRELWTLSQRIGQWKTTEEKYDRMLIQYDETVARMLQLEDDLQDAKQQVQSLGALTQQENPTPLTAPSTTATITTAATAVIGATQAPGTASSTTEPMVLDNAAAATTPTPITQTESEPKTTIPTESNVVESNIEIMAPPRQPAATIVAIPETPPRDNPDNNNNNNNAKTKGIETNLPSSTNEPAAVLVEEDSSESPPGLETLDNKTLMVVFAYLDALDILNTAQINISMYSRVDTLFGLGGHHDTSGDGDNSTIATNDTAFHHTASTHTEPASSLPPPPSSATLQSQAQPQTPVRAGASTTANTNMSKNSTYSSTGAATPTTTTTTTTTAATSSSAITATATQPGSSHVRTGSNTSVTGTILGGATGGVGGGAVAAGEGIRNFFNMLAQPGRTKPNATIPRLGGPGSPPRLHRNAAPVTSDSAPPMNAAMANSMASKLSDAELNAIILMTERLRQKEALTEKLLREQHDLEARLEGTETVKQFLLTRVQNMEELLSKQEENETKVAQQIASDQEVIAFLDGRVQELEREASKIREEQDVMRRTLARFQEQAEQKSIVMGDMLQFEREKWRDSEREWKATKKLLVKEVKNCRAQITALLAERDGYREQNEVLRKALFPTPSTSSSREHTFA